MWLNRSQSFWLKDPTMKIRHSLTLWFWGVFVLSRITNLTNSLCLYKNFGCLYSFSVITARRYDCCFSFHTRLIILSCINNFTQFLCFRRFDCLYGCPSWRCLGLSVAWSPQLSPISCTLSFHWSWCLRYAIITRVWINLWQCGLNLLKISPTKLRIFNNQK